MGRHNSFELPVGDYDTFTFESPATAVHTAMQRENTAKKVKNGDSDQVEAIVLHLMQQTPQIISAFELISLLTVSEPITIIVATSSMT